MKVEVRVGNEVVGTDDGRSWSCVSGDKERCKKLVELAEVLGRSSVGSHHVPPGVMAAAELAAQCGGVVERQPTYDRLPDGYIP